MGSIAVIVGGLSSTVGQYCKRSYHQSGFKQLLKDFSVKDSLANYCLVLVFLLLDFFPFILGGRLPLNRWSCQWCSFQYLFGGIEEIGWRYFFQPTLEEEYLIFQLLLSPFSLV